MDQQGSGSGPADETASAAELETGRLLFAGACDFVIGAASLDAVPDPTLPEIAVAGRSNVGKSSLINALTGRRALARTSNTPGRTQQLNFFDLGGRLMLVDLPGYGYASASKTKIKAWMHLAERYLRGRPSLRRVLLLIDARRGIMKADNHLMKALDESAVSFVGVLTKCDKLTDDELSKQIAKIEADLRLHVAAYPDIFVTSARNGSGIELLRAHIASLARGR